MSPLVRFHKFSEAGEADVSWAVVRTSILKIYGRLAQLGERLPYKQEVGGSIPSPPIGWRGATLARLALPKGLPEDCRRSLPAHLSSRLQKRGPGQSQSHGANGELHSPDDEPRSA